MNANAHQEFLQHYQPIHEAFVRYCSSRAYALIETEDLVQEAVLAALEGFDRLQDKRKLLGYMIGIANNIVRNKMRRQKFRSEWDERALTKLESQTQNPEVALDIHFLLKALQQLPERQREAVLLFEINGFSMQEISEIQESSLSATKTRVSRGRQQLRDILTSDGRKLSVSERLAIYASILF